MEYNPGHGATENCTMEWDVLFDEEFDEWLGTLDMELQDEIWTYIELLRRVGPNLGRPRVDTVKGSEFPNMKELRIQHRRNPWRILFAFDPRRNAILLVGGNKRGDKRWYHENIPIADRRFRRHLDNLEQDEEG
jgi:hypothetical protein